MGRSRFAVPALGAGLAMSLAWSVLAPLPARAEAPSAPPTLAATEADGPIPRGWRSPRAVGGVKATTAVAATAFLGLTAWRRRRSPRANGAPERAGLVALALLGAACWPNLFQFHYPGFGHGSDTFHYYLGAKYFPELRYTGLYACTAVADAEAGHTAVRRIRNLATNTLETTEALLREPERCKHSFSEARWQAFRTDVERLRSATNPRRWARWQQDHGYNATPAWGVLGRLLTHTGPVTQTQLFALRALDPLLLIGMAGAIAWAFGLRVATAASVFFGCSYLGAFGWTGGSILRQDWLFASVVGICLLRREHFVGGGALLALAAALRLFPALLLAGLVLATLGRWLSERRVTLLVAERRVLVGAIGALVLWLPASAFLHGGWGSWTELAVNSRTHLATPLMNHVGLRTVLAHDPEQRAEIARDASLPDPMQTWKQARRDRFDGQRWFFAALVVGFAGLIARAGRHAPLWMGAVLGVAWLPIATELTGYYWSVLLALAFLDERHGEIGAALCGLAAAGWGVAQVWHWTDEIHVWISALSVAFCVYVVLRATPRATPAPQS